MEAFVAIGFGIGNPVPQALGVLLILLRHKPKDLPAQFLLQHVVLTVALYDKAHGKNVVDAFEGHFLLAHLLPDGIGRFCADLQLVLDSGAVQFALERLYEFLHELLTVLLPCLELVGYETVLLRLCVIKVDILHLTLHLVKAQLMGKRNVEKKGLQDLLLPVTLWEHPEAPHHLKAVGQLQDRHARVPGVLDDEFFVVLRLKASILGLNSGYLVKAVYKGAYGSAPVCLSHLISGNAAGLVEIYGGYALLRKANFIGHDCRYGIRMADKRRPVVTGLILQGACRGRAGSVYEGCACHFALRWRMVRAFWNSLAF